MFPDWYSGAQRAEGPEWKQGYSFFTGYVNQNLGKGIVGHSAEGSLQGCLAVLDGPRQVSWCLTFPKVGVPLQHYSLNAITWHCGRYGDDGGQVAGNGCLVGCEVEGKTGEPLTENQIRHLIHFLVWYWQERQLGEPSRPYRAQIFPVRPIPLIFDAELWEHKQISATDCPSNRIPWQVLIEGMEMSNEPTEWERFTKGLQQELQYFHRVSDLSWAMERRKMELIALWRRSSGEPPLDHEIFKEVRALCSQLRAAVNDLEARCHIGNRG